MANPTPFDVDDIWERVQRRVVERGDCWIYTGKIDQYGYGGIAWAGEYFVTHRIAFQSLVGDIDDGLELDHLCRVRACCNPAHLEAVTHRVNLLRGETLAARNATLTACLRGHEYSQANTYIRPDGNRDCRECRRRRRSEARVRAKKSTV